MKIFDEGRSSFLSQSGHEIDDLKDLLQCINDSIEDELMLHDGDSLHIDITKQKGNISWKLYQCSGVQEMMKGKRFGEGLEALTQAISGKIETLTDDFADWSILVYRGDMEPFVSNGQTIIKFWEVIPGESLNVKNGQPFFHEKKLKLQESTAKAFADSGIIFRRDQEYYLISEDAMPQIGGILDCSSILRKRNECNQYLLAVALIMGEKLNEVQGLCFKTVSIQKRMKMIIGCYSTTRAAGRSSMQKMVEDALEEITTMSAHKRMVFVIDEYPYLAKAEKSFSSRLQHIIDHHWQDGQLYLILCGSSMSFMEYQVLGYESPLYGVGL